MRIHGVNISVKDVAEEIYAYSQNLESWGIEPEPGDDDACGDIRIQIHDGGYALHTGDAQYDQDHRGHWGCASVPAGCTRDEAVDIARDLLNDID